MLDLYQPENAFDQPRTADEYIAASLDWAQRCFELTLGTDGTDRGPGTAQWDLAIIGLLSGW